MGEQERGERRTGIPNVRLEAHPGQGKLRDSGSHPPAPPDLPPCSQLKRRFTLADGT